jgi:hypothetical protein
MDYRGRHAAGTIFMILVLGMVLYLFATVKLSDGFVDAGRCGVGLPGCSGERVRCMNGYCGSDVALTLPLESDLPMTPATKY